MNFFGSFVNKKDCETSEEEVEKVKEKLQVNFDPDF